MLDAKQAEKDANDLMRVQREELDAMVTQLEHANHRSDTLQSLVDEMSTSQETKYTHLITEIDQLKADKKTLTKKIDTTAK